MSRRPSASDRDLPIHLRHVFRAAWRECPKGHAGALRDLTALAMTKVPARGIFDPSARGEQDLFAAIDVIASRHLGRKRARAEWRRALRSANLALQARDRIERAALHAASVSDTAYFYAGLAFGLTWIVIHRDR